MTFISNEASNKLYYEAKNQSDIKYGIIGRVSVLPLPGSSGNLPNNKYKIPGYRQKLLFVMYPGIFQQCVKSTISDLIY